MLIPVIVLIFASTFVNVQCLSNVVDSQKRVGIVYFIPIFQPIQTNGVENDNEIDSNDPKLLQLPRLILALAPSTENDERSVSKRLAENDGIGRDSEIESESRSKRSPGGGGCNKCGYNPGGGGGHGSGGGGGGGGSWSKSSSSASSGSWGGGGGKYHGRK